MQDAVARGVEKLLNPLLVAASSAARAVRGTTSEEAYRLFLQGNNLMTRRNYPGDAQKAAEYFEQALRLDPDYALAYAWMAHALHRVGTGGLAQVENEKAKEAVKKALELDINLAEAYAVRGKLNFAYDFDFAAAEKDLLRAIELEPNNDSAHWGYALVLAYRGDFDDAMAEIETALAIDPNSLIY